MAEAEDVIIDAARHLTAYTQSVLRRYRKTDPASPLTLLDAAPRLDLLLKALHGRRWPLRAAQPPAPVTALTRWFKRHDRPWRSYSVPACDGHAIWLPRELEGMCPDAAWALYRAMALQQAYRASRRTAALRTHSWAGGQNQRDLYLVFEAQAADAALLATLPGIRPALMALRTYALNQRPPIERFPKARQPQEAWYRALLSSTPSLTQGGAPEAWIEASRRLGGQWPPAPLLKDCWLGEWPEQGLSLPGPSSGTADVEPDSGPIRSARLARRPQVREAQDDEDDQQPGAWMIQTAQPHEHAEDPIGAQRPTDRDTDQAAEAHAESVSELPEARLIRSAQRAHEVLLSDDAPPTLPTRQPNSQAQGAAAGLTYPEWDYRQRTYRNPGTTVWESIAEAGPDAWVERTLQSQRALLHAIRRRFEMLRAERERLRRQEEGDDIDIEACIQARADLRAGSTLSQRLYCSTRLARRDTAVLVLVDISGSTDAWVQGNRRIIDVEREALLPLSIALDGSGDRHAIYGFSGEGPQHVVVRAVKRFDERHSQDVARRIAGLEPERYTRAGAALRHASRLLAAQPARHQLLLLLSDGKPNDQDDYEGRYGVEDMRQAVREARYAGQSPFCLTVDRQAASYLPHVFGPQHYALLQQPERLPTVLLDWMKKLLAR